MGDIGPPFSSRGFYLPRCGSCATWVWRRCSFDARIYGIFWLGVLFWLLFGPRHTTTLYANEDYNSPLPMVAIALSMTASDYNRDAIVICIGSVTVWRGTKPKAFFFRCVFVCVWPWKLVIWVWVKVPIISVSTCESACGYRLSCLPYPYIRHFLFIVTHTHTHTQKGREHMLAIAFELNL